MPKEVNSAEEVNSPYWQKEGHRIYLGNCLDVMKILPAKSIQTVVTSPPYLAMRDYRGPEGEIGKESSISLYIKSLVEVFSGIKKILRDDGTCWINIGDNWKGSKTGATNGIPWKLAFALEQDNWILRQDIIWNKTTAMPDGSASDRFTRAHEYVFLLTKNKKYYFDPDGVRNETGSRRRSVWNIANPGWKGIHRATFPRELVEICIKAGTSEWGCCAKCGKCYVRLTEKVGGKTKTVEHYQRDRSFANWSRNGIGGGGCLNGDIPKVVTTGWSKSCYCDTEAIIPCKVFDPFLGSGTTIEVAASLERTGWGSEISKEYLDKDAIPRMDKMLESL